LFVREKKYREVEAKDTKGYNFDDVSSFLLFRYLEVEL